MRKDNKKESLDIFIEEYLSKYPKDNKSKKKERTRVSASLKKERTRVNTSRIGESIATFFWGPVLFLLLSLILLDWSVIAFMIFLPPIVIFGLIIRALGAWASREGGRIGKSINENKGEIPGAVIGGILLITTTIFWALVAFVILWVFTWAMMEPA